MNHPKLILSLALTALSAIAVACAGTLDDPSRFSSDLNGAAGPGGGGAADGAPACPDMTTVLAQKCGTGGCHSSADKAGSLDLVSPDVASRLVGVPSKTTGLLLDPANPTASVLYQRIQPTAAGRMPVSGDPLDDPTIACVLTWMSGLDKSGGATPSPGSSSPAAQPPRDGGVLLPREGGTTGAIVRVAAGATAPYTDQAGAVWSADTSFTGGKSDVTSPPDMVAKTNDAPLYNGQRWGQDPATGNGMPFSYSFDVANGSYDVTLKFAELFTGITAAGGRQFDVAINGAAVLTNFDIFSEAGGRNIAVDKTFPITVTGGKVEIAFTSGTANFAKVDAIMVSPK